MLKKIKLKLLAMAVLLSLLPFASTFACPCDGSSDDSFSFIGQPGTTGDGSTDVSYGTSMTTVYTNGSSNTSDQPPYNNYPN